MIPLTGKSEYLYNKVFEDVINLLSENGIDIDELPKFIMSDFEKSLIKAIKKNFKNCIVDGCFFHYVKLIWSKAKAIGLCNKKNLKLTKTHFILQKIIG